MKVYHGETGERRVHERWQHSAWKDIQTRGENAEAAVTFRHGFPGARAGEPKKWIQVKGADHSFSEHRTPLIRGVLDC